jgi:hypothetical protein
MLMKVWFLISGMNPVTFLFKNLGEERLMNTGDTAFVLVSSALVMLMTPGLALFYGGMVRAKNVLGTIMQSFILTGHQPAMDLVGLQHGVWSG